MPFFRKRPVVIEAFRLPPLDDDPHEFNAWSEHSGLFEKSESERDGALAIHTLEGVMLAEPGDWIIKGVKGEFYPVKHDIFELTYEPLIGSK